ncbi:hypothetical protein [Lachnotalea sp. AF33-28]|uniref:hypothetical protein n=1 Tax=Lachnotalea sp. AF33-28 TaxID=2292046 RepID=UPI0013140E5E|nr:hypothetical protein [Lachnotalea sp. AF33-28]
MNEDEDAYTVFYTCDIWNADSKKENRQCMGMCVCVLLYLERYVNAGLEELKK